MTPLIYATHPNGWHLWLADGMAHANLLCALWLVALAIRSYRLARANPTLQATGPLRRSAHWCCVGALLNALLVALHYRVWVGLL